MRVHIAAAVRAARRAIGIPLLGLLVGVGAAAAVTTLLDKSYQATASVVIMPKPKPTGEAIQIGDIGMAQTLAASIARLAESREVALQAATRLKLSDTEVAGHIVGVSEPGIQIVTVRASSSSPQRAAAIADAVTVAVRDLCARLQLGGETGIVVETLDPAGVPVKPVSPRPFLNYSLGGLVGLLIGMAVLTMRGRTDDRFRRVEDLEAELGLPALGVLRLFPRRILHRGPRLPRRSDVESAVDGMLAALTVLSPERSRRRIVVTSVGDRDSAEAVASLIAAGLARHQIRTTLLEGRRVVGIRRYLKGGAEHTVEEILSTRRAKPEALVMVPAASVKSYLGSGNRGRIGALMDALAASGDHVVTSAPPVLAGTDLAMLSRHADVVLLVVASDQARKAEVSRAALLVSRLDVPLCGLVVIGGAAYVDGWERGSWPATATGMVPADLAAAARIGHRGGDHPEPSPRVQPLDVDALTSSVHPGPRTGV